MGGYVALAFAARHPSRLERLILADTRAAADSDEARAGRADALALVEQQGVAALVERQLPALLSPGASASLRQQVREPGQAERRRGFAPGFAHCGTGQTVSPSSPPSPVRPLSSWARKTKSRRPRKWRAMARAIPGARLVEIAGAGHLSNLERPAEFVAAISKFI